MNDALQRLVDRQEIVDGMHAYCHWTDRNRPDEQVKVLTPDCRVSYADGVWLEGRDALLAGLRSALARYRATSHHVSNIEIWFDGPDQARAESVVYAWHRHVDDSPDFILLARYLDEWARIDGRWLLGTRRLVVAGTMGRDLKGLAPLDRELSEPT